MSIRGWITAQVGPRLTIAALLFWLPLIVVVLIADEITEHEPLIFDEPLLTAARSLTSPFIDTLMTSATRLGGVLFIGVATIALTYYCFRYVSRRAAAAVLLIAGGAAIANYTLKLLFQRARPDLWQPIVSESSYSFPSGHAMGTSALAISIIIISWNTKWRSLAVAGGVLYVLLVGLSRVYLGVHYPSDVIAGWATSLVWAGIVWRIVLRRKKSSQN